jgi:hypothetical protein
MESSGLVFKTLVSPLAAVLPLLPLEESLPSSAEPESKLQNSIKWALSPLNPKNRVDTIASAVHLPPLIQWHMSGCSVDGSQFCAYPWFALGRPPLFIDVYIPDQCQHPPALRLLLKSGATVTCPRDQVGHLGISRHVLHALAVWSSHIPDFEARYQVLPFGSRVVVENIASNVHDMRISMVPNHKLEHELLSLTELQELWQSSSDEELEIMVDSISLSSLELLEHTHETISIVSIPHLHDQTTRFVFKAVKPARFAPINPAQTYHELKLLLAMAPHPNITVRPLYVVTGTPKLGICGFILPYYPGGSLLQVLTPASTTPLLDRIRWSRQITSALLHIHTRTIARYHADLKPDNVMLTAGGDAVLVDFEQRGGWVSWIAPEVCYIWYLVVIARSTVISSEITGRYTRALQRLVAVSSEDTLYGDVAWTYLSLRERESAMVFALGKVLWCIFENQPTIYTDVGWGLTREAATWVDDEHSWRFPQFRRTPEAVRGWIERCTAGADEWDIRRGRSVCFDLEIGLFVPVGDAGGMAKGDESRTQQAAKAWWERRVTEAEAFLEARAHGEDYNGIQAASRRRPALREVLDMLEELEIEVSASSSI